MSLKPGSESTPLVVMALIVTALILAITVPNLLNARQRGRQKKTMGDMRSLATACESYSIDWKQYPNMSVSSPASFVELERLLEPTYARELQGLDGWGTPLTYIGTPSEYTIRSFGRDRLPDSASDPGTIAPNGGTTTFNADIVFSTGSFVQFPDGTRT